MLSLAHIHLQVRFVNCYFAVDPNSSPMLKCEERSDVEALGCLFEASAQVSARKVPISDPAVYVAPDGSFSGRHCVWKGLPTVLRAACGKASLEGCFISAIGALQSNTHLLQVSKLIAEQQGACTFVAPTAPCFSL